MYATADYDHITLPSEDFERLLVLLFGEDSDHAQAVAA
jgi:hypothetical protein